MKSKTLTRTEASKVLGISQQAVRNWEKRGRLHPTLDAGGGHHYKSSEVQALRRYRESRQIKTYTDWLKPEVVNARELLKTIDRLIRLNEERRSAIRLLIELERSGTQRVRKEKP